ncbi:hypothetical protein IAC76_01665 [Spirochaetes bacterium]|uniref:Uncharacterized protein n=1 Tax=Candidatus Scatousia excrementipullorum TaxID=2840936 RepID=A0A9D9H049_9BACT|nr:hypothetical protein [Candidatus Scatousia excrementipullorum]
MIESIQDLTEMELRVVVMNTTGYTRERITNLLNISESELRKILASVNQKCETKNIDEALNKMSYQNII